MIHFLVSDAHRHALRGFKRHWAGEFGDHIRMLPWWRLPEHSQLPGGAYIFANLERADPGQQALLGWVWEGLNAAENTKVLNNPLRVMRRRELSEHLAQTGQNRYRSWRPDAPGQPWRYPVFVRAERRHTGALTPLLWNENDLACTLRKMRLDASGFDDLLIVEFVDTSDRSGLFRQYAALRVGDEILPQHIHFSHNWMQKELDQLDKSQLGEMREYRRTNPHQAQLRALFDQARIEYGRIDYSLCAGEIQVWEIDTNPLVLRNPDHYPESCLTDCREFSQRFGQALSKLDGNSIEPHLRLNWDEVSVWAI